jgi:UTP--glucose-1-phosphate uridylyltransferase
LTPQELIANFGTVTGVWLEENRLINITEFAEKPNLEYVQTCLCIPGLRDDQYLTVFGQYILKPEVFDILEINIKNSLRERGDFQLTGALDRVRQTNGFMRLIIEGQRFDTGLPDYYLETLVNFRKE